MRTKWFCLSFKIEISKEKHTKFKFGNALPKEENLHSQFVALKSENILTYGWSRNVANWNSIERISSLCDMKVLETYPMHSINNNCVISRKQFFTILETYNGHFKIPYDFQSEVFQKSAHLFLETHSRNSA